MYKYCYHKAAHQFLQLMKDYQITQFNNIKDRIPEEQQRMVIAGNIHNLAGMILHMESQGYIIPKNMKKELLGGNYDWSQNII